MINENEYIENKQLAESLRFMNTLAQQACYMPSSAYYNDSFSLKQAYSHLSNINKALMWNRGYVESLEMAKEIVEGFIVKHGLPKESK